MRCERIVRRNWWKEEWPPVFGATRKRHNAAVLREAANAIDNEALEQKQQATLLAKEAESKLRYRMIFSQYEGRRKGRAA